MPAVELMHLRQQINQLILVIHDAAAFRKKTRDLLHLYAQHNYRAGQAIQPQSLMPTYRVPALVMRQLTTELSKTCQEQPDQALAAISELWQEPYLEPRLLAAALLGSIPLQTTGSGVIDRLRDWAAPHENLRLITALMDRGTVRLRREAPQELLALVDQWLTDANPAQRAVGIQALVTLVNDRSFQNLPAAYRLLAPSVQNVHPRLQADLQMVLQALIKRSPTETAYFLRQALPMAVGTGTSRLIRRCLPDFDIDQQASLRTALLSHDKP